MGQKISVQEVAQFLRETDPQQFGGEKDDNLLAQYANEHHPELRGRVALAGMPVPSNSQPGVGVFQKLAGPTAEAFNPAAWAQGIGNMLGDPRGTVDAIGQAMADQRGMVQQRKNDFTNEMGKGNLWGMLKAGGAAMGHAAAAAVPMLGPAVATSVVDPVINGDIATGVGNGLGLAAGMFGPKVMKTGRVQRAMKSAGDATGAAIVNMGLRPSTTLTKGFGNLGRAIIDEDIAVTPAAIESRYGQVEQRLRNSVRASTQEVSPSELANKAFNHTWENAELDARIPSTPGKIDSLKELDYNYRYDPQNWDLHTAGTSTGFKPMNAEDLLRVNRGAKHSAAWTERAVDNPSPIGSIYDRGLAFGSRELLDDMLKNQHMTAASELLGREQKLMGLTKAIENAGARDVGKSRFLEAASLGTGIALGHPFYATALAGAMELANHPRAMGAIGRRVSKAGRASTMQQNLLRALAMASHNK